MEKGEDRSMNNYKRIVSYLYYYGNGEKKNNVGYVRMERKDGICKVTIHMRSINSNEKKLGVYFFYREKEQLIGISLGTMVIKNGVGEFRKVMEEEITKGLQVTLEEMGGIIIYENNEHFFATQWDDEFINIMNFYIADANNENEWKWEQPVERSKEELEAADLVEIQQVDEEEQVEEKILETENQENEQENLKIERTENIKENIETVKEKDVGKNLETVREEGVKESLEEKIKNVEENLEMPRAENAEENLGEGQIKILGKNSREEMHASRDNLKSEEGRLEEKDNRFNYSRISKINEAIEKFSQRTNQKLQNENIVKNEVEKNRINENVKEDSNITEYVYMDRKLNNGWRQQVRNQQRKLEQKIELAEKLFQKFPEIDICNKDAFKKCVKIEPQDIGNFPMETWVLANNSFLLHGYYQYRYLIFALHFHEKQWEYVIGVPGIYEPKEKIMARMFGFGNFCPTNDKEAKTGTFGYWYQVIRL